MSDTLDIAHHLLDHQLVDPRGFRCGNVDDVTLRTVGGAVEVESLLAGPGVLADRYPRGLMHWLIGLAGDERIVIPARALGTVSGQVQLVQSAPSLGLASGELRAGRRIARLLGPDVHAARHADRHSELADAAVEVERADGSLLVSLLLERDAFDEEGRLLGRVHDIRVARTGRILDEAAGAAWVLTHLLVGRRGLAERFGIGSGDRSAIAVNGFTVREGRVTWRASRPAA